ncbi:hypothetical protein ACLOJK_009771 [Asimina triloba]
MQMDDLMHLEKFNHNLSEELQPNATKLKDLCSQHVDYFLVLDLEGKVEILEFPVVMINAKTMEFVDSFHRFVRPGEMSEQRIKEYIEGKYGKIGVDRGNWDLKTKVPQQCQVSRIKTPPYFMEWINLKDATGMMTMMKELGIPLAGSHHLGIDDSKNISRVLQRMLADGAVVQITARRNPRAPGGVEFLFKNRIRHQTSYLA